MLHYAAFSFYQGKTFWMGKVGFQIKKMSESI